MTPFGRQPVTAGLLAARALAETPAPQARIDKWAVLRDLTEARAAFGVSDRDLAVLSALLSFYPQAELADDQRLIVFPSNASLSARVHGMPESTLRRHLAALVKAGLILRRDSPNGKRYATRGPQGQLSRAFGFDLRPLLIQSAKIAAKAEDARARLKQMRLLREAIVIHLRDAAKLMAWAHDALGADITAAADSLSLLQRHLRRKLTPEQLQAMRDAARALLTHIETLIPAQNSRAETQEMGADDSQNGRHQQSSITESHESESCAEQDRDKLKAPAPMASPLPLGLVLRAAPDLADYAPDGIHTARDLLATADLVRPMLGIAERTWQHACTVMGREPAAITLACILQSAQRIANPAGYLRDLTNRAQCGKFSPGPMVQALLRPKAPLEPRPC